jgi:gamma-glutamyltranspeptidase/glutathione hydrolase
VLTAVADQGESAFYLGPVAEAICAAVGRDGGCLTPADLAAHLTVVKEPVAVPWNGGTVHVQPPSSQGVLLAMALQWLENAGPEELRRLPLDHLGVELTEAVFGYRDRCARDGADLLLEDLEVNLTTASRRGGPRAYLHTTGVAVADAEGMVVSSLLSVFDDFGAGTFVPECGLVLNNRAAGFTGPPNEPGPGRRPVHTLAPAILETGATVTALATPGADGQCRRCCRCCCGCATGRTSPRLSVRLAGAARAATCCRQRASCLVDAGRTRPQRTDHRRRRRTVRSRGQRNIRAGGTVGRRRLAPPGRYRRELR